MHFWVNWEIYILRKRLSQDALSKVHLSRYGSYFKFILFLSGDVNLNHGLTTPKRNDMLWELFLSTTVVFLLSGWIMNLILCMGIAMTDVTFKKRGMHFIHLSINRLLSKIWYIAKLTNATVIGLSETKLDKAVFSSELELEEYDLVRSDRSQRGGAVACIVKNSIPYNRKHHFCINAKSTFKEIFLPKSILVLIGVLYRPLDKRDFVNWATLTSLSFKNAIFLVTSI